jgi:hypothetical protein
MSFLRKDRRAELVAALRASPAVLEPPPFGEGGLAGRMARHAKQFAERSGTVELTVTPKEIREIADALAAKPAVLETVTVEALAHIIDPKAFIIPNSTRFEIKERQREAIAKAQSIRALIGHPASKGEPVSSTNKAGGE